MATREPRENMQTKLFEIRDTGTFIPAIATRINGAEHYLLRHAGYGSGERDYILLASLNKGLMTYNVYDWTNSRTMKVAHQFIIDNWDTLESGAVIDVDFILGETDHPKQSVQVEEKGAYAL